ncbi:MAG: carbonic anhydrase [Pseudobdellovibrionaceae bacterium]
MNSLFFRSIVLLAITLSVGCASKKTKPETERTPNEVSDLEVKLKKNKDKKSAEDSSDKAVATPSKESAEPPSETAPAQPATPAEEVPLAKSRIVGPISAEKALGWLKNGNLRFVSGRLRKDGAGKKDLIRTSINQSPHAVVISSSDSRVSPELIFDQKLGEIYVVRIVGPFVNDAVSASVDHAVQNLGANLVVILGHQDGADTTGLVDKLRQDSKLIQEAEKAGELVVKSAFYDIKTGQVRWP